MTNFIGVYCQLGDGLIWSQEAAGASPVTPTIFNSYDRTEQQLRLCQNYIFQMTYKLTQLKEGEKGRIVEMTVSNRRLQELGIIKGAIITVVTNNLICMICNSY